MEGRESWQIKCEGREGREGRESCGIPTGRAGATYHRRHLYIRLGLFGLYISAGPREAACTTLRGGRAWPKSAAPRAVQLNTQAQY